MKSSAIVVAIVIIWLAGVLGRPSSAQTAENPTNPADQAPSAQHLDEPAPSSDLDVVQGLWTRMESVGLFSKRRITKQIQGDRETVTYYDTTNNVERAHTVKVDLRRAGPIRIFAFSEQKFTAGPNQGEQTQGSGAYVYKVVDDTFVEIWGVLGDDDQPIEVMRWQRVKP